MKAKIIQSKTYQPVKIKIKFETEREYEFFKEVLGNSSFSDMIDIANKYYNKNGFNTDDIDVFGQIYNAINKEGIHR